MPVHSPTLVDCRLVIPVVVVKKARPVVQNAPVVALVNQVRVMGADAKNVRRVNLVRPTMTTLIRAHYATLAIIKQIRAKHLVCRAYQERIKK